MMEERKEERKKERTNERKAGQAWVWDGWVRGGGRWVGTPLLWRGRRTSQPQPSPEPAPGSTGQPQRQPKPTPHPQGDDEGAPRPGEWGAGRVQTLEHIKSHEEPHSV